MVGDGVGELVGSFVGMEVGPDDGLFDGDSVGNRVGWSDAACVGTGVDPAKGIAVGASVTTIMLVPQVNVSALLLYPMRIFSF